MIGPNHYCFVSVVVIGQNHYCFAFLEGTDLSHFWFVFLHDPVQNCYDLFSEEANGWSLSVYVNDRQLAPKAIHPQSLGYSPSVYGHYLNPNPNNNLVLSKHWGQLAIFFNDVSY